MIGVIMPEILGNMLMFLLITPQVYLQISLAPASEPVVEWVCCLVLASQIKQL
jgi:hypothetical protein